MDFARQSGVALIPARFVWPHGGRDVYISGSFTGWTQWPMTPVEGCPTVFQTICSLPQGYHQYKFVVDGEWRHDEHQPFVSSNIGTVNTILLTRESDYLPTLANPKMLPFGPGSSMDVDNETFAGVVRLLDFTSNEPFPRISDTDLEISRHRIAVFTSTHMAYELLPESGKVIALDVDLPVKQAFHILHEQGISMAPLWDFSKGKFVGVLSALDFILIIKELRSHGSNPTEEELETHTISAWKEAKSYLNSKINASRQLVQAGPDDNLKEVALKILQNGIATIPIIHSPSEDVSNQHLLHLASLSGILKSQVSSIPIVDDNDSLLDIYSRSDITTLAKDKIYTLINLEETTIHQALQYRDDPFSNYGYSNQRCHMCLRSDPLHKVMERLSKPDVRRLVIIEAGSKRVEGIISLSDVFWFLLGT